jgi:large subunit ribosomal protein L15
MTPSKSSISLDQLAPPRGSRRKRQRVARGESSGSGKTAGRGGKGQKGRKGATIRAGFEGGQMPMYRRLPKIGFRSRKSIRGQEHEVINLAALEKFPEGSVVDASKLIGAEGSKKSLRSVKILGDGTCSKKLTVKAHAFSAKARQAIEAVGGTVEVIARATAAKAV